MSKMNRLLLNSSKVFGLKSTLNANNMRNICSTNALKDIFKIQDENDFKDKVLNNKNVVIVDFHASWCGPCKILKPRLETIIGTKTGKGLDLAEVDVDENETIASQYQVTSVPTVFAMSGGKVIDQFIGLKDEDQLRAFVGKALNEWQLFLFCFCCLSLLLRLIGFSYDIPLNITFNTSYEIKLSFVWILRTNGSKHVIENKVMNKT